MKKSLASFWGIVAALLLLAVIGFLFSGRNSKETKTAEGFAPILGQEQGQQQNQGLPPQQVKSNSTNSPVLPMVASGQANQKNNMHIVTISTNFGDIQFETYDADAPKAAQNFIALAQKGFYNNLTFHRVIPGFMIQGGDPSGNGTGGPGYQFEDELNPNTESYKIGYKKGVVAMANAGPDTNGSQFFIMHADYNLPHNYTIFGHVVRGQETVDAIAKVPTGAQDRPQKPVVMKEVKVAEVK